MVSRNNNLKIDYLYIVKSNTYKKMLKKNNNLIVSFIFFILFNLCINIIIQYVLLSWITLIIIFLLNIIIINICSNVSNLYYLFQITCSYLFIYLPFLKQISNLNKWVFIKTDDFFEYTIKLNDFININNDISLYIILLCLCNYIIRHILNIICFFYDCAYKYNYICIFKSYINKCIYIWFIIWCIINLLLLLIWYLLWVLDLEYWELNYNIYEFSKSIRIEYSHDYRIDCYSILWEYIRINSDVDIPMNSNIMDSLMKKSCKTLIEINENCTKYFLCLCEKEGELVFNNLNNELLNINSNSLFDKESTKKAFIFLCYITTFLFFFVNPEIPGITKKEQDWWENGYPDLETIISYLW